MKKPSKLITDILTARGVPADQHEAFLNPDYDATKHDPFLLPDMRAAVDRLLTARDRGENVTIYGDYDIDGMTATTILLEAFEKFGINADTYTPNRFIEGYGLNMDAMRKIAETDADLIVTVDCGSLSHAEIDYAGQLGMDVIVTDHHAVAPEQPNCVATINPRRDDHEYPFRDLAGCGVAFKLVQALQIELSQILPTEVNNTCKGLPFGQEKWLLDLVALGTVCDVVNLQDENRAYVKWGLEVMKKTRRPGLRALMAVSGVKPSNLNARALGFALGPRLNAAGRLETAEYALELLRTDDPKRALELAQKLDEMNRARRAEQDVMLAQAIDQAEKRPKDAVLVVSHPDWNEGIIGIVAAKLMEKYERPTFVLAEVAEHSKGSGRSFGEFKMNEVIASTMDILTRGGGHAAAGGLTVDTSRIDEWREAVNNFYRQKKLTTLAEKKHLLAHEDITRPDFSDFNLSIVDEISKLEPFGHGNPTPIFAIDNVTVMERRTMGADGQHVKYFFADQNGVKIAAIAFNAADKFDAQSGEMAKIWVELDVNEWNGRRNVEGRLLRME